MKIKITALLLCLAIMLSSCNKGNTSQTSGNTDDTTSTTSENNDIQNGETDINTPSLDDMGLYDGIFDGESVDIDIVCVSGTQNAYTLDGTTLTFTSVSEDTVYYISGTFKGNIIIDVGDDFKFDLELHNFSLVCDNMNPITVLSGDEVAIKAKKDTKNYIYDTRAAIDKTDDSLYSGAIHSKVDLEISGKGFLTVVSENNNGIHTKDDLQVKNLNLTVSCVDNALKGNDSVEMNDCNTTLIATNGDGIKTSSSDVSKKGKQRGSISISGGTHNIFAAFDGIDAAYDVIIDGETTVINICTNKYSSYSSNISETPSDNGAVGEPNNEFNFGGKNDGFGGMERPNGNFGGDMPNDMPNMPDDFDGNIPDMPDDFDGNIPDDFGNMGSFDFIGGFGGFGRPNGGMGGGGFGGMNDGNQDKSDESSKGIKADNEIIINNGKIDIRSYDDSIHANNDVTLESGATPSGNVTINGGSLSLFSNDDAIHADGTVNITNGTIDISGSYEGIEGNFVNISGGDISVIATDDGINATATSGEGIVISAGNIYVYCTGDGLDSNSRTSYSGIVFSGGNIVIIANSSMNSAIDTEQGYRYDSGNVIAIMPRSGMTSEATHCKNFSSIGKSTQMSLSSGAYLQVSMSGANATIQMPTSMSANIIVLGDKAATITTSSSTSEVLNGSGVAWN